MRIELESVVYRLQKLKTLASLSHLLPVTIHAVFRSNERAPSDSLRVLNKHVTGNDVMRWKRLRDRQERTLLYKQAEYLSSYNSMIDQPCQR